MKQGLLIVISGPSGVGKGTVAKRLAEASGVEISVSTTTRPMRPAEMNGVHYNFVDYGLFTRLINDGFFLEYAEYNGNFYGTPAAFVRERVKNGVNVILEIDVLGGLSIMERYDGGFFTVFLLPPTAGELENRLKKRGVNSADDIAKRVLIASREMEKCEKYDYAVVNDDLETAVSDIKSIIRAETLRTKRNADIIQKTRAAL